MSDFATADVNSNIAMVFTFLHDAIMLYVIHRGEIETYRTTAATAIHRT